MEYQAPDIPVCAHLGTCRLSASSGAGPWVVPCSDACRMSSPCMRVCTNCAFVRLWLCAMDWQQKPLLLFINKCNKCNKQHLQVWGMLAWCLAPQHTAGARVMVCGMLSLVGLACCCMYTSCGAWWAALHDHCVTQTSLHTRHVACACSVLCA